MLKFYAWKSIWWKTSYKLHDSHLWSHVNGFLWQHVFVEPDCVSINLDKWVKKDEEEGPLFWSSSWHRCCIISKYSFQVEKSFWNIHNDLSLSAPGTLVFNNLFQGGRRFSSSELFSCWNKDQRYQIKTKNSQETPKSHCLKKKQ